MSYSYPSGKCVKKIMYTLAKWPTETDPLF